MAEPRGSAHLSIGEVLGLLLEEFPDVTISKIRFLESQGLIEPERTPSGYRKFFDGDVELLRVILREQRERFLPLRVIKDRIDSGEIDTGDPTPPRGAEQPPTTAQVATHPSAGATPSGPSGPARPAATIPTTPTAPTTTPAPSPTAAGPPARPVPERAAPAESQPAARLLPGVLVNRDELCAMASITREQLAQLEEFGVVPKRTNAGDLYGDESVEIAAAAGGFLRSGVDARHLRAWRTSADREAGLYEQLILPTLRQRNPQARAEAARHLGELDALGAQLRTAMMRAALRQYLE
jgi:DNA-binding transcriptional MerR regulator